MTFPFATELSSPSFFGHQQRLKTVSSSLPKAVCSWFNLAEQLTFRITKLNSIKLQRANVQICWFPFYVLSLVQSNKPAPTKRGDKLKFDRHNVKHGFDFTPSRECPHYHSTGNRSR